MTGKSGKSKSSVAKGKMEKTSSRSSVPGVPGAIKSDLIGVAVLAVGIAAVIGVGYLAYVRFFPAGQKKIAASPEMVVAQDDGQTGQRKIEDVQPCPNCGQALKAAEPLPDDSLLHAPGEEEFSGRWSADFGMSRAYLYLKDSVFEIIYLEGADGASRRYTRGLYEYDPQSGVLTLMPNRDMGEPSDAPGIQYSALTWRTYGVRLFVSDKKRGILYWAPATLEEGRRDQTHPLFLYTQTQDAALHWSRAPD